MKASDPAYPAMNALQTALCILLNPHVHRFEMPGMVEALQSEQADILKGLDLLPFMAGAFGEFVGGMDG
jgi:hypothetical protein